MRFVCRQQDLVRTIDMVERVAIPKEDHDHLKGIYMKAHGDQLTIFATDLEISIKAQIDADVRQEGEALLNSRVFSQIVRKLDGEEVTYDTDAGRMVTIKSGRSHFTLHPMTLENYPPLPEVEEKSVWTMEQSSLRDMIRKTIFASAKDDSRPFLTGILVELENKNIRLVSTDSSRLAFHGGQVHEEAEQTISAIVPARTFGELSRILADSDDAVAFSLSPREVLFRLNGIEMTSRVIEGRFPDYTRALEPTQVCKFTVDRRDLLATVERVSLVSVKGTSIVTMVVDNGVLTLTSREAEIGEAVESIDVKHETENGSASYQARFLIDVLRVMNSETVQLEFGEGLKQGRIIGLEEPDYTYIVMPVRVG